MRLHLVFAGSVSKDDDGAYPNEDQHGADASRQRYCISDGASQSYAPSIWARTLVEEWLSGEGLVWRDGSDLEAAIRRFEARCQPPPDSWAKAAAYDRGTFATLLGVHLVGDRLEALILGDSLLVVSTPVDRPGRVETLPYVDASSFNAAPMLPSTLRSANQVFDGPAVAHRSVRRTVDVGTRVLLMTDALGRWLLSRPVDDSSINLLAELRSEESLREFVRRRQADGTLHVDDCTLVHLLVVSDATVPEAALADAAGSMAEGSARPESSPAVDGGSDVGIEATQTVGPAGASEPGSLARPVRDPEGRDAANGDGSVPSPCDGGINEFDPRSEVARA